MNKFLTFILLVIIIIGFSNCASTSSALVKEMKPIDAKMDLRAKKYYYKGILNEIEMDYENALLNYYMARSFDPDNIALTVAIAETQMKLGNDDVALIFLDDALKVFPEDRRLLQKKAEVLTKLKRLPEAYILYKKLLQKYPYSYYYQVVSKNLAELLNDEEELQWLYQFIANQTGSIDALVDLGRYYFKKKKYVSAIETFQSALKKDSTNMESLAGLVDCYISMGKYQEAIPILNRIYQYTEDPFFINKILELFYKQGKYQELVTFLSSFLQQHPSQIYFYVILANAYYNLKDLNQADKALDTYRSLNKSELDENYFFLKGQIYLDQKKDSLALSILDEGLKQYPNSENLTLLKAFTLSNLKKYNQAIHFLQKQEPKFKDSIRLLTLHAQILFEMGKKEDIVPLVLHILKQDSTNHFALTFLASHYMDTGESAKCDSIFQKAIHFYPDDALILNNYAYFLSTEKRNLKQAMEMVNKALEKEPNNPAYLDTKGWIYYQLNKFEQALKFIQKAAELSSSKDADLLDHLGDVYWKLQQFDKAREYWKKALEIQPENKQIKMKLEKGL